MQVAEGGRVLSTPGHSPGHQSVVFDTADVGVVLAGQAIYSKAEYEHLQATNTVSDDDPPPDPEQYLASAARLQLGAMATSGEVLVSGTVKDLVVGSGIEFRDRGEHELKGVPATWRLYAVVD